MLAVLCEFGDCEYKGYTWRLAKDASLYIITIARGTQSKGYEIVYVLTKPASSEVPDVEWIQEQIDENMEDLE